MLKGYGLPRLGSKWPVEAPMLQLGDPIILGPGVRPESSFDTLSKCIFLIGGALPKKSGRNIPNDAGIAEPLPRLKTSYADDYHCGYSNKPHGHCARHT